MDLFPKSPRNIILLFHANGNNILGPENLLRVFAVVDALRERTNFASACTSGSDGDMPDCEIVGVTNFWMDSSDRLRRDLADGVNTNLTVSRLVFPNGRPVPSHDIYGHPVRSNITTLYTSIQSYVIKISYPQSQEAGRWEGEAINVVTSIRDEWLDHSSHNGLHVEVYSDRAMGREFLRGIREDLVLVPCVFAVMTVFTGCTFGSCRREVPARSVLGFAAVFAILLSIAAGLGRYFILGIPFTSITQPFVLFGIGLDDAFIIMGAYNRTAKIRNSEERIRFVIHNVGMSIVLTTTTSCIAFPLGCLSSVPAISGCLCTLHPPLYLY